MNRQEPAQPRSAPSYLASPSGMAPRTFRATAMAIAGLVVVLASLYGFNAVRESNQKAALAANKRPPTAVSIDVAQLAPMSQLITAVGSLTAVHQVIISSEVAGQITQIGFEGGAAVKKGAPLVQLNDSGERADLASYQAQQKLAELALQRGVELQKRGNLAEAQLDQMRSQYDVAAAGVARTQAIIAKKNIRAPFDGRLGVREVEVGQYLAPGQPIAGLTDPSELYLNISVPEQERPKLSVGQPVILAVDAYPGRTFDAHIAVIDPQINPEARTVRVQARAANPEYVLSPGMFAKASVVLPPIPDVLTLPETAVGNSLYGDYAFLAVADKAQADGKERLVAKRVQIVTGDHFEGRVAVLKGLKAGDRVVAVGLTKVVEGGEIVAANMPSPAKPTAASP